MSIRTVVSPKALDLIKEFEGCKLTPYICPAGALTVGYGHVISFKPPFSDDMKKPITKQDAERLLREDTLTCVIAIDELVKVPLTENQAAALVSFIFNVGTGAFKKSTLLKLLNRGDYAKASMQFERWVKSNGEILPGLVRRREAERKLFETE